MRVTQTSRSRKRERDARNIFSMKFHEQASHRDVNALGVIIWCVISDEHDGTIAIASLIARSTSSQFVARAVTYAILTRYTLSRSRHESKTDRGMAQCTIFERVARFARRRE